VVVPLHRNPVVREAVMPALSGIDNVRVIEPMGYGGFARLMNRADLIVTDSGGIQEEAPSLGKPVLVLRDTTERPEAVAAGTVELIGTNESRIVERVRHFIGDANAYQQMAKAISPYGDGRAAQRSVAAMAWLLFQAERPLDFVLPESVL
jgi:UDP-N-acetylglucosamine 2-epimerase (non-hydrolysing)